MNKSRVFIVLVSVISLFIITACNEANKNDSNESAIAFKEDYEAINGTENKNGKVHRTIKIDSNNSFVEVTAEEIVKMIENKETFYVYFGSRLCPWCRSTIEMADKISRDKDVKKIYYVDIWDDEGNEILRDKYSLNDKDELILSSEGTEAYKKLIVSFDGLLDDYTLTDSKNNSVKVGEKRIYAPNYFYVENGVAERITTGISELQKDSREELTEEILADEEKQFDEFFINSCDSKC